MRISDWSSDVCSSDLQRRRAAAMAEGATLIAPETVWFAYDTAIGRDVTIEPNVVFGPGVSVADKAVIHAFSHLEGASVGRSEEHTSELQSLMSNSYAVFCLQKKKKTSNRSRRAT